MQITAESKWRDASACGASCAGCTHLPGPESPLAAATALRFCATARSFALAFSMAALAPAALLRSRARRAVSARRSAAALASAACAVRAHQRCQQHRNTQGQRRLSTRLFFFALDLHRDGGLAAYCCAHRRSSRHLSALRLLRRIMREARQRPAATTATARVTHLARSRHLCSAALRARCFVGLEPLLQHGSVLLRLRQLAASGRRRRDGGGVALRARKVGSARLEDLAGAHAA